MNGGEKLRLFVAVPIPEAQRRAVAEATKDLRDLFPSARWVAEANQHVTLKFLGPTGTDLLDRVVAACADVAAQHGPASARVDALGAFPTRTRVRVLWVGLDDPRGVMRSLAAALEARLEPLGFPAERRDFTAHLTLARLKMPARVPEGIPEIAFALEPFEVDSIVLFRSFLSPKGARYEALETFALGS